MLRCSRYWHRMCGGGNQWSHYAAYLSFFRHVAELDLPEYEAWKHYEDAAIRGGPRMMHEEFCIVSDRPEVLKVDEQNRPHAESGPFCRWRDGTALYYIHGVEVSRQIVEAPETLTVEQILGEENAEVRRVMVERYGFERLARDTRAQKLHEDEWGILWCMEFKDDEPLVAVEVVNSTPEPDGSFKNYTLRVPPGTRTALEAVAWTFGISPDEYLEALCEQT